MKNVVNTKMMSRYIVKLMIRIAIFISVFAVYLFNKDMMTEFLTTPLILKIQPLHFLWLAFMGMMILHILPHSKKSMALRKMREPEYQPVENYSEAELHNFVKDQNVKALIVMLVWLSFNAIFGILYLFKVIGEADLLMLTVFYFLCDYICILFFCPFQTFIMKNKCCVNCRIYDWGHFMMFTPMLFICNFYSWSLFFTSCIVLIHWEIVFMKSPERFWSGSNKTLQCMNCKDKTCKMKKRR